MGATSEQMNFQNILKNRLDIDDRCGIIKDVMRT